MSKIFISKDFPNQLDIENCIDKFYKLSNEDNEFRVIFTKKVKEIDILLFGYITLFKELKPTLIITLEFNSNIEDNEEFKFKLFQYLIYAFLATGKTVFSIKFKNGDATYKIDENSPERLFHRYFVLSESFLPILLINGIENNSNVELFEILFQNRINNENNLKIIPEGLEFHNTSTELYKRLNRWIKGFDINISQDKNGTIGFNNLGITNYHSPGLLKSVILEINNKFKHKVYIPGIIKAKERFQCIQYLAKLAYYKSLDKAKILSLYMCPEHIDIKNLRVGSLSFSKNKNYPQINFFEKIKEIFDDLSNKPPIYHFVYSLLLSSNILPSNLVDSNVKDFKKTLFSLWDFTKDFVYGIKELAKNIREHPDPPIGIITGRIYNEEIWSKLKKTITDDNGIFEDYRNKLMHINHDNMISFFDLNVIDLGKHGMINTLIRSNEKFVGIHNLNKTVKEIIERDISELSKGSIKLKHFLNPLLGISLNQQAKRATAHIGLLIFSKLIRENKGLVRAGTWEKGHDFMERDECLISFYKFNGNSHPIKFGTNYHVVLPITERDYQSHLPHPITFPLESVPIEIEGIEELLNYKLITIRPKLKTDSRITDQLTPNNGNNYLYRILFIETIMIDRDSEYVLWDNFNSIIQRLDRGNKNIICIDFVDVTIDASRLFRFLGNWELNYPKTNIIIINLENLIFDNLININEEFNINSSNILPYWNENSISLFYTYSKLGNDGNRFYFTDALWGKSKEDFININKLIRNTNFNATTILSKDIDIEDSRGDIEGISIIAKSGLFYAKTTLLPFDLLLPGRDELTLFEHNASVLLQNELISITNSDNDG
jgi:hypothetical protein